MIEVDKTHLVSDSFKWKENEHYFIKNYVDVDVEFAKKCVENEQILFMFYPQYEMNTTEILADMKNREIDNIKSPYLFIETYPITFESYRGWINERMHTMKNDPWYAPAGLNRGKLYD